MGHDYSGAMSHFLLNIKIIQYCKYHWNLYQKDGCQFFFLLVCIFLIADAVVCFWNSKDSYSWELQNGKRSMYLC